MTANPPPLEGQAAAAQPDPSVEREDDRSSHRHRRLVGMLGLFLPPLVVVLHVVRPTKNLDPEQVILDSVSAYAYSAGAVVLVGMLAVLAAYLLSYRGFANTGGWRDRAAATIAGIAAVGVAGFPTEAPNTSVALGWWKPWVHDVHIASAFVLFGSFIFISLFQFTKSDVPRHEQKTDKKVRNGIYVVCGVAMLISVAAIWVCHQFKVTIFWGEAAALWFFAFSWLTKGRTDEAAGRLVRKAFRRAHPGPATP